MSSTQSSASPASPAAPGSKVTLASLARLALAGGRSPANAGYRSPANETTAVTRSLVPPPPSGAHVTVAPPPVPVVQSHAKQGAGSGAPESQEYESKSDDPVVSLITGSSQPFTMPGSNRRQSTGSYQSSVGSQREPDVKTAAAGRSASPQATRPVSNNFGLRSTSPQRVTMHPSDVTKRSMTAVRQPVRSEALPVAATQDPGHKRTTSSSGIRYLSPARRPTNSNSAAVTPAAPATVGRSASPVMNTVPRSHSPTPVALVSDHVNTPRTMVVTGTSPKDTTSGISIGAPVPIVVTYAGKGVPGATDGLYTNAEFNRPAHMCLDPATGDVYVAEYLNHTIRRISGDTGEVSTIVTIAPHSFPGANSSFSGSVRATRTKPSSGSIDTAAHSLRHPIGIAFDAKRQRLVVGDSYTHCVRAVSLRTGELTTLAGMPGTEGYQDGPARDAKFFHPSGLDVDVDGNVFVADQGNHSIRLITAVDGMVYTVAGCGKRGKQDGDAGQATFLNPMDVKLNKECSALFVADYSNHTIRRIDLTAFAPTKDGRENGALVATLVRPDGNVLNVVAPAALCMDGKGAIYVACKEDHTVRKVMPSTSSLPGLAQPTPRASARVSAHEPFEHALSGISPAVSLASKFKPPHGHGPLTDAESFTLPPPVFTIGTIAGVSREAGRENGHTATATFSSPFGVLLDARSSLLISDGHNHCIRRVIRNATHEILYVESRAKAANLQRQLDAASDGASPLALAVRQGSGAEPVGRDAPITGTSGPQYDAAKFEETLESLTNQLAAANSRADIAEQRLAHTKHATPQSTWLTTVSKSDEAALHRLTERALVAEKRAHDVEDELRTVKQASSAEMSAAAAEIERLTALLDELRTSSVKELASARARNLYLQSVLAIHGKS